MFLLKFHCNSIQLNAVGVITKYRLISRFPMLTTFTILHFMPRYHNASDSKFTTVKVLQCLTCAITTTIHISFTKLVVYGAYR